MCLCKRLWWAKEMDVFSDWRWWIITKNIRLFRLKSALTSKKEFDSEPVYTKNFF